MTEPNSNNGKTAYKLSIQGRLTKVETLLDEIKDNHLPHIETKINWIMGLMITALIAIVLDLISRLI